ncbi:hypothetical protein H6G80_30195 [Nostoc sp. FACHB-87]|uniref:hypothetical protein n=1 Tax=Nostocaceae TaxID=1162 RepID=UPI00168253B2|nr:MULTISPECIES: hypothetical protein [Nostocaceae]MBD2458326.1 hypothetical protein [Nostoc sp. FACHB-87]MBD2479363.1 hypothetical protein [Anabaena sp. FACHB-83]
MNADNRIMVRISTEKKEAFMNKVKQEGKNASEVLLDLIDSYLGVLSRNNELEELKQGLREEIKAELRQELGGEIALLKQQLLGELAA